VLPPLHALDAVMSQNGIEIGTGVIVYEQWVTSLLGSGLESLEGLLVCLPSNVGVH
jgi:hypothetical protein